MCRLFRILCVCCVGLSASGLPPLFVPNAGQAPAEVQFLAESGGVRAAFTVEGLTLVQGGASLRIRFVGSQPGSWEGVDASGARANFLTGGDPGSWRTNLPLFGGAVYRDLYPGIDALYGTDLRRWKSEFRVAPGADPTQIQWRYGDGEVSVDETRRLWVRTDQSTFSEDPPVVYSVLPDGSHRSVEAEYLVGADGTVGFQLGFYNPALPLVIDPVITYSTYLGGTGNGAVTGVARDGLGNLYAAGWTESLDFPIAGAFQASNRGGVDAFVVKLDPTGSSLLYATYIGGSGDDRAAAIAVDSLGQAHAVGSTASSNFPLASAARSTMVGGREAFALKLNAAGSALAYSTFLGGSNTDSATALAVDASGFAYVAGDTYSADFAVTGDAVQSAFGGRVDAFLAKLSSAGAITYSTFLGGLLDEHAGGVVTDGTGIAYVVGGTLSTNFPVVASLQATNAGGQDAFVTKIQTVGTPAVLYSTYLGGSGGSALAPEQANAVALDGSGNLYVTGVVSSTNFPVTSGTLQTNAGGSRDVFICKLNPTGTVRLYSTYLGWTGFDWANGIAVDSAGSAYVTGYTSSVGFSNVGGLQSGFNGLYDAFVTKLNPAGNALSFSTLYGGTGSDQANAIAVDANGNMFLGGQTSSFDFPAQSALLSTNLSGNTGWVARIGVTAPPSQVPSADDATIVYGANGAATITARFSHPGGAAALTAVAVLLSRTATVDFACWITYNPSTNSISLANNVSSSGNTSTPLGSGSLQNTQCTINTAASSRTMSGNTLTLTLSTVLDAGFPGNNTIYLYAADASVNTGWVAKAGTSVVSVDSAAPSAGSGASQVFTFVFSDTRNAANVWGAAITINSTLSNVNSCSLVWDRAAGTIALLYNSGAGSSPKPFGSNATIQNSQCALGVVTLSVSGNSNILTVPLAFTGPFTGPKNIYMLAVGPNGNTGWQQKGTYSVFAGGVPVAGSVAPSAGAGSSQTFSFVISDQGGSQFLVGAAMALMKTTNFDLNNSCYIVYDRASNRLSISADTVSNGSAALVIGSAGSVSNSQCTLFGSGSSVTIGSTTITITLNLSFNLSFAGTKNTYLYAAEVGYNSGWKAVGTWTAPGAAPTVGTLSPVSGTGTLVSYTATFTTPVAPSDLTTALLQVTSACAVVFNPTLNTVGLYDDNGVSISTKTIGSSATLQNSQCAVGFSSATTSGGTVTFTVILVFKTPAFSGPKSVYLQGSNPWGTSPLTLKGSWTVP